MEVVWWGGARCIPSSVTGPWKENSRGGRVQGAVWTRRSHGGDVFPLGSVIKLSVGQRGLNALHRGRGERERETYSPICIYSPHHISTAMNEALIQAAPAFVRQPEPKPFTTRLSVQCRGKNSFVLFLRRAEYPEGGVLQGQMKVGSVSQNLQSRVTLPSLPSSGAKVFSWQNLAKKTFKDSFSFV